MVFSMIFVNHIQQTKNNIHGKNKKECGRESPVRNKVPYEAVHKQMQTVNK